MNLMWCESQKQENSKRQYCIQFFQKREGPPFGPPSNFRCGFIRFVEFNSSICGKSVDFGKPFCRKFLAKGSVGKREVVLHIKTRRSIEYGVIDTFGMIRSSDGENSGVVSLHEYSISIVSISRMTAHTSPSSSLRKNERASGTTMESKSSRIKIQGECVLA